MIPSDGDVIEGIASVDELAITGESAPVIRESGGDRSAVTGGTRVLSDWIKVRITADTGIHLPRSHDRAGGRRRTAEDAERDRAEHPARRPDAHLRVRGRDHSGFRQLRRRHGLGGDPGRAVRRVDPHHDRRAAVGDRHRRHGPPGTLQRAGDVRPRGGGGGRRRHAAARQDRHDHAGQSSGHRVPAAVRRDGAGTRRRRAVRLAVGRDAGRPFDRGAGEGEVQHPRPRDGARGRALHCVLGADATVRRRPRRLRHPQGRGRCGAGFRATGRRQRRWRRCRGALHRVGSRGARTRHEVRRDRPLGRHAAGGGEGWPAARRHPSEGHRQGRHPGALRRAAPHGHPHRDDHRRQPAHRRGDRRRSRAWTTSSPRRHRRPS